MANVNIDTEALYDLGVELGLAFAALSDGFTAGMKEYELYGHTAEERKGADEAEAGEPEPGEKTEISDCRSCWCDRCLNIEVCQKRREDVLPEGDTPFPCIGCKNGMRFMPEDKPPCEDFTESGTRNNG